MKIKMPARILLLFAVLLSVIPGKVFAASTPPLDMFQLPWEQGKAWVAYDGLDNGTRRKANSPHNYKNGGAMDFAPHVNMQIGEDTSKDWVTAAAAGTVSQISSCFIQIDHGNGWLTEYWHLDKIQVKLGDKVSRNQRLAIIHNNKNAQVCLGNEYPGPHLHFVFRPKVTDTLFAGWKVNYNSFTNATTFSKDGQQTVGLLKPLMNIPSLQIVSRGVLNWDTFYTGTVDMYRYERWSLTLTEQTQFTLTVAPEVPANLASAVVLLDADGHEITRSNGVLSTNQPAGSYFVQIQSDAGTGYYDLIATRVGGGNGGTTTVTATPTSGTPASETPVPTGTPNGSETPGGGTDTPTPTNTPEGTGIPSLTPTSTETSGTPSVTDTFTPTFTETPGTPIGGDTETPTMTPFPTNTSEVTDTPFVTETPMPTSTSETGGGTPTPTETPIVTQTAMPTPSGPYVLTDVIQSTLFIDDTSSVNVSLLNLPSEGYASAEFTCTYDPTIVEASNFQTANVFGTDPASAMSGPQNGQFILAIAGSNGRRATSDGLAFTFELHALQMGTSTVQCTARVSQGQSLVSIGYVPDTVTVTGFTPSPTATLPTSATVNGQVIASKPVTIQLFDANTQLVVSQVANSDGTFSIPLVGGTYTIVASAPGFLNAQGSVTLTNGVTTTMSTVSLLAGDIDGNGVIDQFDALTIGMNYNGSLPTQADLNNDGVINVLDLELLAANYRKSGALAWQ